MKKHKAEYFNVKVPETLRELMKNTTYYGSFDARPKGYTRYEWFCMGIGIGVVVFVVGVIVRHMI